MKIRAIQWAAVDTYLQLVRLPFDAAIRMFPDGGIGIRPAAAAAVDGADAGIRSIVALVLGDPVSADDAAANTGHEDREEHRDSRSHKRKASRPRHSQEKQERPSERRGRPRHQAPRTGQPASTAERRAAAVAVTGTARQTAVRTAGSETRSRVPDIGTVEDRAPQASVEPVPAPPSDEQIAARAYELYMRGTPGDAESHWEAAKRELSASRSA